MKTRPLSPNEKTFSIVRHIDSPINCEIVGTYEDGFIITTQHLRGRTKLPYSEIDRWITLVPETGIEKLEINFPFGI